MKKISLFLYLFLFASISLLGDIPPKIPETTIGYGYITASAPPPSSNPFTPVGQVLIPHGYMWADNQGSPGNNLVEFMSVVNGYVGFLMIAAHGRSDGWMQIEDRGTNIRAAELRRDSLLNKFNAGSDEIRLMVDTLTGECQIVISPLFLQKRTNLPYSIVYLNSCHSHNFTSAFTGAGCCFGWSGLVEYGSQYFDVPMNIFYRTGGRDYFETVKQTILRNKTVAEAMNEYRHPELVMYGDEDMKLYNSPRIAGVLIKQGENIIYQYGVYGGIQSYPYEWDYGGRAETEAGIKSPASIGDKEIQVKILFSSFMDEEMLDEVRVKSEEGNEEFVVSGGWTGGTIFGKDLWEGTFTIDSWEDYESKAFLVVDAKDDFERDVNERLDVTGDGNSNGVDERHEFEVTDLPIVVYTDPSEDAKDVPVDKSPITITFSKPMNQTVTAAAVQVPFACSKNWRSDEVLEIVLDGFLIYCKDYTIIVAGTAKSKDGVLLDGNEDGEPGGNYPFTFTTESPELNMDISPEATNVAEGSSIRPNVITNGGSLKYDVKCNISFGFSGGWSVSDVDNAPFSLSPGGTHRNVFTLRNNGSSSSASVSSQVSAKCAVNFAEGYYWSEEGHRKDHPDENQSPGKMEYPTPWLIRTQSSPAKTTKIRGVSPGLGLPDIGILLSGWADGYGHILGRYGMETLPVKPDLKIINNPDVDISDAVKLLVIGSAGLKGFNSPTFKNDLEDYVVNGGNLLVLTQKYGSDLSVLPGDVFLSRWISMIYMGDNC